MSHPFTQRFNDRRVRDLCEQLISQRRGKMLGDEILAQLSTGALTGKTFARLCRWVHPRRQEPTAQPVAEQLSRLLYGRTFPRED
jgi:hypothetical protein